MALYRTLITVTADGRKLAPGVHEFSKETGDKLVARGFAKEAEAPAKAAAPAVVEETAPAQAAPARRGRQAKAVKNAEEAEGEASEGEAQAEPAEQGDGA